MNRIITSCVLLVCLLTVLSCRQSPALAGKYRADSHTGSPPHPVLLLKEDGKGTWAFDSEDASFIWESKGSEVWLHAKTGGVVVGKLRPDRSIDITLPGTGSYHFTRDDS
jgi:hypothetical protein